MFLASKDQSENFLHRGLANNVSMFEIGGLYRYNFKKDMVFCYIGGITTICSCNECDYDIAALGNKKTFTAWFYAAATGEYYYFPMSARQVNDNTEKKIEDWFERIT